MSKTWLDEVERLHAATSAGLFDADLRRLLRVARAAEAERLARASFFEALERSFSSATPAPDGDLKTARDAMEAAQQATEAALHGEETT